MSVGTGLSSQVAVATRARVPGWGFVAIGVLYATFYAPDLVGIDETVPWVIAILIHLGLLVVTIMSLVLAFRLLEPDGWLVPVWIATIFMASLGLTVGIPFWGAALIGLAIIALQGLKARWVSLLIFLGAALWLFLFVKGVRIGDEIGRPLDSTESAIALLSLGLMSAGLIGMGWRLIRHPMEADSHG